MNLTTCLISSDPVPRVLPDAEIAELLAEVKRIPSQWRALLKPKVKSNTKYGQNEFSFKGHAGHSFALSIRTANDNLLDFSIILAFSDGGHEYNLIRHNGKHKSDHTNIIEHRLGLPDSRLRNVFHIHHATQRYQEQDLQIEGFAQPTTLYSDVEGAIELMVSRYGFIVEVPAAKLPLFDKSED
jgi:hypothetical protein